MATKKCSLKCPYWYFRFNFPIGIGPICTKYKLPLLDARDRCFKEGKKKHYKKKIKKIRKTSKPIIAHIWPGSLRGFGPITIRIDKERKL